MGLVYPVLRNQVVVGTKVGTTRTSVALTSTYAGNVGVVITPGGSSEVALHVLYTTGAAETNNSIEVKADVSTDGTNYYQLTNESASSGTSTLYQREFTFVGASAATAYALSYRLDVSYPYLRFSFKESGVAANAGTVFAEATIAGY